MLSIYFQTTENNSYNGVISICFKCLRMNVDMTYETFVYRAIIVDRSYDRLGKIQISGHLEAALLNLSWSEWHILLFSLTDSCYYCYFSKKSWRSCRKEPFLCVSLNRKVGKVSLKATCTHTFIFLGVCHVSQGRVCLCRETSLKRNCGNVTAL